MGGIREQVEAVASGAVSAVEAAEAAIARIEAGDGEINAVVVRDFDRALDAARAVDARRAKGERLPLLGLPMTVKEAFDVAGLPTSWGLEAHAGAVAETDAVVVRRLREAGAVIVGKTNVPPSLSDHQSSNPVYGVTHNPHRHGWSPGGSSGGAAAAVAAGFVAAEVGSDIGGSIRIPASFCGVWGLKPTFGLISKDGHAHPGTEPHSDELSVAGPIAGSAEDLDLLLGVLADHPVPAPTHDDLRGVRVAVLADQAQVPLAASVRTALDESIARFEAAGAIVDWEPALPDLAFIGTEYLPMLMTIMAGGLALPGQEPLTVRGWFDLLDAQARTQRGWSAVLADHYDVVLSPVFSTPSFPIDDVDILGRQLDVDGTAISNVTQLTWIGPAIHTGLPSVAFPAGRSPDGLPIGFQLMGPRFRDRDLLHLASLVADPAAVDD